MAAEAVVGQANKRESTFQAQSLARVKALMTYIRKFVKVTHCTKVQCLKGQQLHCRHLDLYTYYGNSLADGRQVS